MYDGLLYSNSMALRMVNVITQYPFLPRVIQDYYTQKVNLFDSNLLKEL
jgi:hypothetical protein